MSTIIYDEPEVEVIEEEAEEQAGSEKEPAREILSLPKEEIDRILAEEQQSRPKLAPDPCLLEVSSEDYDEEPITEYQDSMEAAGYPYW